MAAASGHLEDYVPFAAEVAKGTGLDFYTILGWVGAEGGPPGNPLNLNPGRDYGSEHAAALATIANLKTPLYRSVLGTADPHDQLHGTYPGEDKTIAAQAHAIALSPWNNAKDPRSASAKRYEQNIDANAARSIYAQLNPNSHTVPGQPGRVVNPVNGPSFGGAAGAAGGALGAVTDFLSRMVAWWSNPENWKRIGLGVGGLVLVVGGVFVAVHG